MCFFMYVCNIFLTLNEEMKTLVTELVNDRFTARWKNKCHCEILYLKTVLLISLSVLLMTPSVCFGQQRKISKSHPSLSGIRWDNSLMLPSINGDTNKGVSGAFSGFLGNDLIIVGGSNFPDNTPWNGGHKTFYRTLYQKDLKKNTAWKIFPNVLPLPLAYGVSIQLSSDILCIGGCNAQQCSDKVFLISKKNGQIKITDFPSLPSPLANATGALLGNCVYIAGGQERMDKQEATNHFYVLNLTHKQNGWKELNTWPGDYRGYAVSAAQYIGKELCFYLFSGRDYKADGYVKVLTDGYVYHPQSDKWERVAGEFPVMAATAVPVGNHAILFLGGVPKLIPGSDNHPGFDNTVRLFNTDNQNLSKLEIAPYPLAVTTNTVFRKSCFYITCGEVKPGIRTPHILKGTFVMK